MKNFRHFVKLIVEAQLLKEEDKDASDAFYKGSLDAQVDHHLLGYSKSAEKRSEELDHTFIPADAVDKQKDEEGNKPEDLDMDDFVSAVYDLINNFSRLVEIESTILRRAVRFIKQSHGPEAAQAFKDALREQGKKIGTSDTEFEAEEYKAPPAAGAGPGA
jgi:hypothetical protein